MVEIHVTLRDATGATHEVTMLPEMAGHTDVGDDSWTAAAEEFAVAQLRAWSAEGTTQLTDPFAVVSVEARERLEQETE
jgi:hypothetical protein